MALSHKAGVLPTGYAVTGLDIHPLASKEPKENWECG